MKKIYTAPSAELVLLAPAQEIASWKFGGDAEDRWAFNGLWGFSEMGVASQGTTGVVEDEGWKLPD